MGRVTWRAALLLAALARPASAQQRDSIPPIDTDRPDFTDGMHTMPQGRVQLETGYTYQRARGDAAYSHSFPEVLLRFGAFPRMELRIGQNYLIEGADNGGQGSVRGLDDLYLGTKINVAQQRGEIPGLAFELKANVPTGAAPISAHRVLPGGAVVLGWDTDGPWSAGIEGFVSRTSDATQAVGSLSVQFQATQSVQLYAEIYTVQPINAAPAVRGENYGNSGVLLLLANNVQLDARVGAGLNHDADAYFLGLGFAIRR